jgi:hypothetical protein
MRDDSATRPARLNGLRGGDEGRGERGAVTKDKADEAALNPIVVIEQLMIQVKEGYSGDGY